MDKPSYELIKSSPAAFIVSSRLVQDRLDAVFFQPQFARFDAAISESDLEVAEIGSKRVTTLFTHMPGFSKDKWVEYVPEGIPYLLQVNVQEGYVDPNGWQYITLLAHSNLKTSQLKPGDVLLTATGMNYGKAAVVPQWLETANVCPDIFRVVLRKGIDPYYVASYLNSEYGQIELRRHGSGANRPRIITQYARKVRVVLPPLPVQTYIGDKVRLAESCRTQARELLDEAKHRFAEITQLGDFSPSEALAGSVGQDRLTERMAAEFYLPAYLDLEHHLQTTGLPVISIAKLLQRSIIRTGTPDRVDFEAIPCILTSDIDPHQITCDTPSLWITEETHKKHKGRLQAFDVVYTSVGPPVGEAALVLPGYLPMAVGGDVSVLRAAKGTNPGYLCLYLNTVFGQMQNDRYARGIRQRRVYPEDVGSFLIPVPEKPEQDFIGKRVVAYERLNDRAADLAREAKADVEALIEGRLDVGGILAGRIKPPNWEDVAV